MFGQGPPDRGAQRRQHLLLEPRMFSRPDSRAPRRMRERKMLGEIGGEVADPLGERAGAEHMILGIASDQRSEEHTSELQSLMRISYAGFCLKKKKQTSEQ